MHTVKDSCRLSCSNVDHFFNPSIFLLDSLFVKVDLLRPMDKICASLLNVYLDCKYPLKKNYMTNLLPISKQKCVKWSLDKLTPCQIGLFRPMVRTNACIDCMHFEEFSSSMQLFNETFPLPTEFNLLIGELMNPIIFGCDCQGILYEKKLNFLQFC